MDMFWLGVMWGYMHVACIERQRLGVVCGGESVSLDYFLTALGASIG